METITLVVGLIIGMAIGFLAAHLIYQRTTPQELLDWMIKAYDRAEKNPQLRSYMEAAASKAQAKIQEWLKLDWMK